MLPNHTLYPAKNPKRNAPNLRAQDDKIMHRPNPILKEAAVNLKKYFYKPPQKLTGRWKGLTPDAAVSAHPDMSVAELIRMFYKDPHTYHDPRTQTEAKKHFPKPWVEVTETKRKLTIKMGPFVGIFTGTRYQEAYEGRIRAALAQPPAGRKLVIDLTGNRGGNEKVMLKALKGIELWGKGTVLVSRNTASAGEMLAAVLKYDHGFTRKGPRTAGLLSKMKNIILTDGSFLGVTTGYYTTPGGHVCRKTYI